MVKEFKVFDMNKSSYTGCEIFDIMDDYIESLRDVLDDLDFGDFFEISDYSKEEFVGLLKSFIKGQRGRFNNIAVPGSWGIINDDGGIPSDARVDFVYTPTYIITAILSRTYLDYPEIAQSLPKFESALKKGLHFCTLRDLSGHGYDYWKGQAAALEILGLGHIPELLEKHPNWCPHLLELIKNVTKDMLKSLDQGNAHGLWGESLEEDYRGAVATIILEQDKELVEMIKKYEEGVLTDGMDS